MNITKEQIDPIPEFWRESIQSWVFVFVAFSFLIAIYYEALSFMVEQWQREEYSHAYILPFVSLFFIWLKKNELSIQQLDGSWGGVFVLLCGVFLYIFGELSSLYILIQYGFLIALGGVIISLIGFRGFRMLWAAYFMLFFMVPLPNFIQSTLSANLQLISSEIGVAIIRLFNISVYLEGNVIDLGTMKLQVVDACSGLRYMFPLMALSFISAYLYKTTYWKRVLVFLSAIPITVLMNSFRIGLVGITVEYFGKKAAEGFLHDFEGWIIFMLCTGLLVVEMWALTMVGRERKTMLQTFRVELPDNIPSQSVVRQRKIYSPFGIGIALLATSVFLVYTLPERSEMLPPRKIFATFPLELSRWHGRDEKIQKFYLEQLRLTDYLMANYRRDNSLVNFYIAYYDSQRKGESAHSPKTCIPGGGWEILKHEKKELKGIKIDDKQLYVNRTLVQLGNKQQLIYYWFQQRGRIITNEYAVKWYMFWDSMTKSRTDGALLRLSIPVNEYSGMKEAENALYEFIADVAPLLTDYIPD